MNELNFIKKDKNDRVTFIFSYLQKDFYFDVCIDETFTLMYV